MPRTGWSHIRRADRALEGNQGTLSTQRPGSSRESTTSFAAKKVRGLASQAGGLEPARNQHCLELNKHKLARGFRGDRPTWYAGR